MRLSLLLAALTLSWASTVFAQPNMPSGMGNPPYNQGVCNPNGNNPYAEEVCDLLPTVTETYTADCTKDSGALARTLGRISTPSAGIVGIRIFGDCNVDPYLRFSDRDIVLTGSDENGQCTDARLVNTESEFFQISAVNGAKVALLCLELEVLAPSILFSAFVNSRLEVVNVTAPPVGLVALEKSTLLLRNSETSIAGIFNTVQSAIRTTAIDFIDGAGVFLQVSSDLQVWGGPGSISLFVDNGSSADLSTYGIGDASFKPPTIVSARVTFDSRLRTSSPVLNLSVDDSSVAITPDLGP